MLVERFQSMVKTDYHQFHIDPVQSDSIPDGVYPEFTLAVFGGQSIRVGVGIRVGPVNLVLEMHDSPPPHAMPNGKTQSKGTCSTTTPAESSSGISTPAASTRPSPRHPTKPSLPQVNTATAFGSTWPTTEPEPAREIKTSQADKATVGTDKRESSLPVGRGQLLSYQGP